MHDTLPNLLSTYELLLNYDLNKLDDGFNVAKIFLWYNLP